MNVDQALTEVEAAEQNGKLSAEAVENIRTWLTQSGYREYVDQVIEHIEQGKWRKLDDVFWTVIPFGTGGRRGCMYPIGSNAINDRTIGESVQGLADYVRHEMKDTAPLSCAIAYDTRHRSRRFAELSAGIMVAAGFKVYFLDGYRSTPELSFLVRERGCACGVMVTASHNPPSDNAVKVYWSNGGQILPPHDQAIIDCVMNVRKIEQSDFHAAVARGQVELCGEETDNAFLAAVEQQSFGGPRDIHVLFSPLHGVGASAVRPLLQRAGFEHVEVFGPHAEPSGDFPNVPEHVSNPENPRVFDALVEHGRQSGAELILATDPDGDRMGCAAPLTLQSQSEWAPLNGNQIGVLLTDYVLSERSRRGSLSSDHYLVKTLVTTEMIRRIGDSYGVRTWGNYLVGFKWIGAAIDHHGPDRFVLGCEESHGYLAGQHARDKDGAVACLLMSELAARLKSEGKSLHERLNELFCRYGAHAERLLTFRMEGSEGMENMKKLMSRFRDSPPDRVGGTPVEAVRDYLHSTITQAGETHPLDGPVGNMVIFDLADTGNTIAVRPSGTEPKVKFYMFAFTPSTAMGDLEQDKERLSERLDVFEADIQAFCASIQA